MRRRTRTEARRRVADPRWSRPSGPPPQRRTRSSYLWQRVRRQWTSWRSAGAPERVLRWIREGARCEWNELGPPAPFNKGVSLRSKDLDADERHWLDAEEQRSVDSGAWQPVSAAENRWVSRAFLVPKPGLKDGRKQFRLVVDLRPLNLHCKEFRTRYQTLASLSEVIMEGEEVAFLSFDLMSAYHSCAIAESDRQYFGFCIDGRHYQCSALPFGWNASPYIFNAIMKTLTRMLSNPGMPSPSEMARLQSVPERAASPAGRQGMSTLSVGGRRVGMWQESRDRSERAARPYPWHILPYCDDYLVVIRGATEVERRQREVEAKAVIVQALEVLGLTRQPDKGQWDALPWIHHLGMKVSTVDGVGMFEVTPQRVGKIRRMAKDIIGRAFRGKREVSPRSVRQFCGLVQSCYLAIPVAQLFQRSLFDDLTRADQSSSFRLRLCRQSLRDLEWWAQMPRRWNGRAIRRSAATKLLYADASDFAWGAVLFDGELGSVDPAEPGLQIPGVRVHGALTLAEQADGIMANELRAAIYAVEAYLPELRGATVRFMEDNQAVMFSVNKWSSRNPLLHKLLRRFWALCDVNSVSVRMEYVRSACNPADEPSRWKFRDEWRLCGPLFNKMEGIFGPHSIDLFASRSTHLLPRYVSRFLDPEALAVDAFSVSWAGERSWINADWDSLPKVAQRLEEEPAACATVVCPYFPGELWFQRLRLMSSDMVVLPWDPSFAEFPQGQSRSASIGPREWSIAFVHIPVRYPGPAAMAAEALRRHRASTIRHPDLPEERDYLVLPLLPVEVRTTGTSA